MRVQPIQGREDTSSLPHLAHPSNSPSIDQRVRCIMPQMNMSSASSWQILADSLTCRGSRHSPAPPEAQTQWEGEGRHAGGRLRSHSTDQLWSPGKRERPARDHMDQWGLRPGREVRLALLGRPSPPRVLGLPLPAAVPSWRAYLCRAFLLTSPPPHAGGEGAEPPPGNGEDASSPGARPPSSSSRCWCCGAAQGESGPGLRLLFSSSAPAPFPAGPGPGPRPIPDPR